MALFGRETEADRRRAAHYAQGLSQRNPFAIASTVVGVFSLIEFGTIPIFGIAGLVMGIVALRQLRAGQTSHPFGHRLAWLGIVTSCVALIVGSSLYIHRFMIQ
jgi:uncharacterized protein DUF4190